jgi:hypothetical protein
MTSRDRYSQSAPRIADALSTLESLIRGRYPDVVFTVFEGEDPEGVYLRATVDLDDPDEVMDVVVDALYRIQVEQELPVYVIPVQPLERVAAHLHGQRTHVLPARFRVEPIASASGSRSKRRR